eukprot:789219-Pleurochrysis_carterae.AAC.4
MCIAVVALPACSTWSAARFEPGDPQVLRTTEHLMGVPQKDVGFPRRSCAPMQLSATACA